MLLRIGVSGEDVRNLQGALNCAGGSNYPDLDTDSRFGWLTHRRVCEFQGENRLQVDGVAGPQTHAALDRYLKQFLSYVNGLVSPHQEAAARDRIVDIAVRMHSMHGFRLTDRLGQDRNRISCNNWYDKPTEERQGGAVLSVIAALTGNPHILPHKCLTLTQAAKDVYDANGMPIDIGKWCGAFVFACYRLAGLKVETWPMATPGSPDAKKRRLQNKPLLFDTVRRAQDVRAGDYGVEEWSGKNHYFLIVDARNDVLETIEGNVPYKVDGVSHRTIIRQRKYSARALIKHQTSGIGRPVWAEVL